MDTNIRSKAAEVAGKAKERVEDQYNQTREQATNEIHHLASALRNAADNVRNDGGSTMSAMLLTRAADRIETLGSSFTGKDLDGVVSEVERLARRNPAAFIGGAMLIGFAASRFLKSSSHSSNGRNAEERFDAADLPDYGTDLRSTAAPATGTTTGFGTTSPSTAGGIGTPGGGRGPAGTPGGL